MHTLFGLFVMLLFPSYLLFFTGFEIFLRNTKSKQHLLSMLLMMSLGTHLLVRFLEQILPIEMISTEFISINYAISMTIMGFGLLFFRVISIPHGQRSKLSLYLSLLPFLGSVLILLQPSWLAITIQVHGPFRSNQHGTGMIILLIVSCLYTFIGIYLFLSSARKRLNKHCSVVKELPRFRIILMGSLWTIVYFAVSITINMILVAHDQHWFNFFSSYCVVIWAISIRYAMTKFDFLASAGRRYELLFKLSHSGIVLLTESGRIVEANSAFRQLAGVEEGKIKGMDIFSLTSPEERNRYIEIYTHAMSNLLPLSREIVVKTAQGEIYNLEIETDYIEIDHQLYSFLVTRDITQQKENEHKLAKLAYQDTLTDLGNRRQFISRLEEELKKIEKDGGELGIMLIDLDQFKWVNDTLGHSAGDILLQHVATKLLETLPNPSFVSRLGGDEFAIILPGSNEEVFRCAEELISVIAEPLMIYGKLYTTTASIGVSLAPLDGNDFETLIRNADTAMYAAKNNGRNQIHLFTPQQKLMADKHLMLINGLANALSQQEFMLYYQPQVDLRTNRVHRVEALLRWNSSELGWVPPNIFIPIAEETGTIIAIGAWVLQTAIHQTKLWLDQGYDDIIVSVNLSPHQLREPQFTKEVARMLAASNLPPRHLCLELTESVAINNAGEAYQICCELTDMGIMLAIDDFGMGYSSLSMLNRFPFYETKIDRSLLQDIETNSRDLAVTRTIIQLSKDLGMQVVAEGVETKEQHEILQQLQCHSAQGYLYGKPMDTKQISAYLAEHRK